MKKFLIFCLLILLTGCTVDYDLTITNKEKINVIHADAFKYCEENNVNELFDFAYMDIWHGAEDGLPFYFKFKKIRRLRRI